MPYLARHSRHRPAQIHRYVHPRIARRDLSPLGLPEDNFFRNGLMPEGPDHLDDLATNEHDALPFPNAAQVHIDPSQEPAQPIAQLDGQYDPDDMDCDSDDDKLYMDFQDPG